MKRPLVTFALALSFGAVACDAERGVGPRAARLELEVFASFAPDNLDTPSFTRVLRNVSAKPVTLVFPSSCVVLPYIETVDGHIVHPGGGGWGCLTVISTVTLAAGGSIVHSEALEAGPASYRSNKITLPAGRYRAYAELDGFLGEYGGPRVQLRSREVIFQVPD
jgi:hypothetical protein